MKEIGNVREILFENEEQKRFYKNNYTIGQVVFLNIKEIPTRFIFTGENFIYFPDILSVIFNKEMEEKNIKIDILEEKLELLDKIIHD